MLRYKRMLLALITRHSGKSEAMEQDRERAAALCAAGQLTADEYQDVLAALLEVEE